MTFSSAIIKLNSICNLNCSYCYMFNGVDKTFQNVSDKMDIEIAIKTAEKISIYCTTRKISNFKITLHGGEPTLWPLNYYERLFSYIENINISQKIRLQCSIQSNGLRISERLLRLCNNYNVPISISLDGPEDTNDQFRVDHNGEGSYKKIINTVEKILNSEYRNVLSGFLSVINLNISPAKYYDWICQLPIKRIDVLWPIEVNYDSIKTDVLHDSYINTEAYGKWLTSLFEIWFKKDDPDIYIRSFFNILTMLSGGKSHIDSIGNDILNMFVVNTDGQIEYPDYFRSSSDGACSTSFSIIEGIECLEQDELFKKLLNLRKYQPSECTKCQYSNVCGGGFLPGRVINSDLKLDKKSIFCRDHMRLFSSINSSLLASNNPLCISDPN